MKDIDHICLTIGPIRTFISYQCDQMDRLFVQFLAIYSNENFPKSI